MERRAFLNHSGCLAVALAAESIAKGAVATPERLMTYKYPRSAPRSPVYRVWVNGQEQLAYQTSAGAFVAFSCDGSVSIEIEVEGTFKDVRIAPARYGIKSTRKGNRLVFRMAGPAKLLCEIEGLPHLFVFANAFAQNVPDANASKVRRFAAGQIYEVGELQLADDETLYIEAGAIVRGCIRATSAKNVRIAGHGILDGSYFQKGDSRRTIVLEGCRNCRIEDLILIEPSSWMIMLGACEDVVLSHVKELGVVSGSDGVDVVGCRRVRIEHCFHRNGDDCIAIKALDMRPHGKQSSLDYTLDVEDIVVVGCSFMSYLGGQAMEIGHELRAKQVRNIRFVDCDVLKKPNYGAPFGIHNADSTVVSDVLFENIRVEHYYDKLVDFRIVESRWSKDKQRGKIRNVTLRNIDVTVSQFKPGYSTSQIGGWDSEHKIEGITFDNFRMNGKRATNADALSLYVKYADNVAVR
jgi:Glycosyl hydrolases family 28